MKKIFIFLIAVTLSFITTLNVNASSSFYEGEYIDGIYMNKQKANSQTIYYQKARFFRQTGTNRFAYCIDPFVFFEAGSTYEETITPKNLTEEQKEKISLIAYFGYGYKNHTDSKWYAITQMMIWKTADPTGNFYFTNGLNGPKIEIYTQEINEINNLINNYKKETSINNKTYIILDNEDFVVEDTNQVLNNYHTDNSNFVINENQLIGKNLTEGEYTINLIREESYHNQPILFYQSQNSQALMQTGDLTNKIENLKVKVVHTSLEITKLDKDTNSTTPSGEGTLEGAIYGLYNEEDIQIGTITIQENGIGKIENIPFGKYYIKEIKAPTGYQLNPNRTDIEITEKNSKVQITVTNEIIKKEIEIYKTYDENKRIPEAGISFTIYNNKNEKVTTITTDKNGKAQITLPYGEYKIVQNNTTDGYHKIDDIILSVKNDKKEILTLTDYKIKVPNTKTNFIQYFINLILKILKII